MAVALRKESVDRNQLIGAGCAGTQVSLSARRAWIEISLLEQAAPGHRCRSPQGERG